MNDQQREAVAVSGGPLLVVAGAGSGKTRVLISRIQYLIESEGVPPGDILGITFTKKAAEEMRERLASALGPDIAQKVTLSTFHSLGASILREYQGPAGLSQRFGIVDEMDAGMRIRSVLGALGVKRSTPGETPRDIQEQISHTKSHLGHLLAKEFFEDESPLKDAIEIYRTGGRWEDLGRHLDVPDLDRFARYYAGYQADLARDNVVDYDDLIGLPLLLFLSRPEIGRLVASQWQHILVDEYQDTDYVQDHLVRILSTSHRNLCVVGDEAQAIYSWRQAKVENIRTFATRYAPCRTVTLNRNYRSSPDILDVANAILENRPEISTAGNTLWTSQGPSTPPRVWTCMTQESEANAISEDILGARQNGDVHSFDDVLILYRKNSLSRPMEAALQRHGIPYRMVNSRGLLDRKEVRDLVAFLRIAHNPRDQTSFERATSAFRCGVGTSTLEALAGYSRVTGEAILTAALGAEHTMGLRPRQVHALHTFAGLVQEASSLGHTKGVAAALHWILEETGIRVTVLEALTQAEAEEDDEKVLQLERRLHDIDDFVLFVEEYARRHARGGTPPGIEAFLVDLAVFEPTASGEADAPKEAVTLMTVHASKGLEAERVYVMGLEEQVFPAHYDDDVVDGEDPDEHLAEEARLFYVAITRARSHLVLSASRTRETVRGDPRPMIRSRFLASLPEMGYRPETHR